MFYFTLDDRITQGFNLQLLLPSCHAANLVYRASLNVKMVEVFCRKGLSNVIFAKLLDQYQVFIAQWLARRLATGVGPGSNPGKGDIVSIIYRVL